MSDQVQTECVYKVLLLGDSIVGKTCILMRFTEGTFPEIHMSTVGLDYRVKQMTLENGQSAKVCIWDTAGQERFRAITKNYYKGAHGIMLIYDVTRQETFDNVRNWLTQVTENASDNATIFLIGNKCDDVDGRQISTEEGKKVASDYGITFIETSAKKDINISSTFEELVKEIYQKVGNLEPKQVQITTQIGGDDKKERHCCKS